MGAITVPLAVKALYGLLWRFPAVMSGSGSFTLVVGCPGAADARPPIDEDHTIRARTRRQTFPETVS
jgi:hypothetical protein